MLSIRRRHAVYAVLAPLLLAGGACSRALEPAKPVPAPVVPKDSIETSLFLIGDAGSKAYDGEPVLVELSRQALAMSPVPRYVVFLGDNVYPRGIPDSNNVQRDHAERQIAAQVHHIRKGGARGFLIPGNHDWDRQGLDGWNSIRRQEQLVASYGGDDVRFLPRGGCPGPEVVDIGEHLRLIVLDSEWWVHNDVKPFGPSSPCATKTYQEVADSLGGAIRDAGGRNTVVVTHHPIRSGGVHGGSFPLVDHIFPIRKLASWFWLPLPVIGSIYPLARKWGISNQDISGSKYKAMRRLFEQVFAEHPPLLFASGHDHDLQVIKGGRPEVSNAQYLVISGAGILGHASLVHAVEGSLFERETAGFMRVDITKSGKARLSVTTVVPEGESAEVYSLWLEKGGI